MRGRTYKGNPEPRGPVAVDLHCLGDGPPAIPQAGSVTHPLWADAAGVLR